MGRRRLRVSGPLCAILLMSGCVSGGNWGEGARWPSGPNLVAAAKSAATDPNTWVPLATAGVLLAADVDEKWSRDLAEDQKIFGGDAEDTSDDLRDVATGAYVLTALLAPSDSFGDKARGLSVGAATMVVDGVLTTALKEAVGRERPDGSNDKSMPSGHASKAASRTAMAMRNLDAFDMPDWSRGLATWSLRGLALGTGLARVEAEKHHLSDVLVGCAVGQFVAHFMYEAFFEGEADGPQITFAPVPGGGGAMTLTVPL